MTLKLSRTVRWLWSIKTNCLVVRKHSPTAALAWQQPILLSSILTTGLLLGVSQLESLQPLELMVYDQMVRLKPESEPDPRILVVEIAEADIQNQKQWPLSDLTVAKLLANLQPYQPKVIGLDLYRDIPHQPGHAELLKQLQAPNIVVITKVSDDANSKGVPPPTRVPKERTSFNDLVLDPDGVIRRNFMYTRFKSEEFYSFSLRMSLKYLKEQGISLKVTRRSLQLGSTTFVPLESDAGGYQNIDAQGYQVLLNYRSRNIAHRVTLSQALNGQLKEAWVKDKVVLIGTTAPSEKDIFFTPYNAADRKQAVMPGVLVHAQMVSQILSTVLDGQPLFWFWSQWVEAFWVWGWSLVGGILVARLRHPFALGIAGTLALGALFGICFGCFLHAGWIPFLTPALALVGTASSMGVYQLFRNSFYDALTGLPNRVLFLKRLQKAIARTKQQDNPLLAVIFLDLDRFKYVNESFGHQLGDGMLVAVAKRLRMVLRSTGAVARIGGDEFAMLLEGVGDISQATSIVDRLQQELALPFNLKGQEIFATASVGIAFNQAGYDHQPEELLRDAHTAMYRAKALGKARYEIFSKGMHVQVVARLQLEADLRHAIERQEFFLNYQPIVSLSTGEIAGFEALVRWQHPEGKFISPAEFIPVAEETGLIVPLGEWILQESCRQLRTWQEQFPMQPPLMLSVNLSPHQFSQPDLIAQIEQTLKTTQLDGLTLKLEITESMAMNDVEATIAKILDLKALKLRFSIDDFGTGYSSLSYLHRFPVDTLKVDRSFVSRMEETSENAAIVQTIVMLSHSLGMDVVAEGVETASQMEKLRLLQCEYGQGYFFSKPLNSEAATDLLASRPKW